MQYSFIYIVSHQNENNIRDYINQNNCREYNGTYSYLEVGWTIQLLRILFQ